MKNTAKRVYWILSGEGELGTWTRHYVTPRGIKRIATRERCGGDRWAKVFVEVPETWTSQAHRTLREVGKNEVLCMREKSFDGNAYLNASEGQEV